MRTRAVAILIENDSVALIERHRAGRHYFTFPGGGVDDGESVEQAVIREMEEEAGLRVAVKYKIAEVWFQGNRQEYFLVERLYGEFGTGTGPEFGEYDPIHGTYHPLWMPVSDLLNNPVLPVEMADLVLKATKEGWPKELVIIFEESH